MKVRVSRSLLFSIKCLQFSPLLATYVYILKLNYLGAYQKNTPISWRVEHKLVDVWYASFGSNMWKPRFLCYIEGGQVNLVIYYAIATLIWFFFDKFKGLSGFWCILAQTSQSELKVFSHDNATWHHSVNSSLKIVRQRKRQRVFLLGSWLRLQDHTLLKCWNDSDCW